MSASPCLNLLVGGESGICIACGGAHTPARRLAVLERLAVAGEVEVEAVRAFWPCLWPHTPAGYRMLLRDLERLRLKRCEQ